MLSPKFFIWIVIFCGREFILVQGQGEECYYEAEAFLKEGLEVNPMKCEYYLPSVVTELLEEDKATARYGGYYPRGI